MSLYYRMRRPGRSMRRSMTESSKAGSAENYLADVLSMLGLSDEVRIEFVNSDLFVLSADVSERDDPEPVEPELLHAADCIDGSVVDGVTLTVPWEPEYSADGSTFEVEVHLDYGNAFGASRRRFSGARVRGRSALRRRARR